MSSKANDPAFPTPPVYCETEGVQADAGQGGMTMREWYAGQALAGLLASRLASSSPDPELVSAAAFRMADAMLAQARKE